MTQIFRVGVDELDNIITVSSHIIKEGGLVVFPTETVYGLGADAYNEEAVKKIYKVKGRPLDNPLIVHISDLRMFEYISRDVPNKVYEIIKKLWPGPFTVVVYRGDIPPVVSAGLDTVAVRMPAHPIALKLISHSNTPIAAPSANKSGRPSPTTAEHVIEDLYGDVDVIIDAGETLYGVESTVIDFTSDPPTLLRPGPLTPEDLKESLGIDIYIPDSVRKAHYISMAKSPGMKYRHYAPKASLILVEMDGYEDLDGLVDKVKKVVKQYLKRYRVGLIVTDETYEGYLELDIPIASLGSRVDLYSVAKNLFKMLRLMDSKHVDIIICEGFPDEGLGLTIMNRLRKAASKIIR